MKLKCIISIILLLTLYFTGKTQFYYPVDLANDIDIDFVKKKTEISPEKSYFNILKVKNNSLQQVSFKLDLAVPPRWKLMGQKEMQLTIESLDSILLPVRVGLDKNVKGEIGYAVVASISNRRGEPLKTAYSFVNVPKKGKLKIMPIRRVVYLDSRTKSSLIEFSIQNRGNVDELVSFNMQGTENIIFQETGDNFLLSNVNVKNGKDTLISFPVFVKQEENSSNNSYKIDVKASSKDTINQTTIWLKKVDDKYNNLVSRKDKPLSIELVAQDIFSENKPLYGLYANGNVLFKRNKRIYYQFRNSGNNWGRDRFFDYNKYFVGYSSNKANIKIGTVNQSIVKSIYGNGIDGKLIFGRNNIGGVFAKSYDGSEDYALNSEFELMKKIRFGLGGVYSENLSLSQDSYGGTIGSSFNLINNHKIGFNVGYSRTLNIELDSLVDDGYGYNLSYSGSIGSISNSLDISDETKGYIGPARGRRRLRFNSYYFINPREQLATSFNHNANRLPYTIDDVFIGDKISEYSNLKILYRKAPNSSFSYHIGTGALLEKSNSQSFYPIDKMFTVLTPKIYLGTRLKSSDLKNSFSPSVELGYTKVQEYSDYLEGTEINNLNTSSFFSMTLKLNARFKYWGFFLNYFHGPTSISAKYAKVYNDFFYKTLRIAPYFEKYIYKKYVKLISRISYVNERTAKSHRVNLSNIILGDLGSNWEVELLNTVSYSVTYDPVYDENYKYKSGYFELLVRKEFGLKQPRLKFYDLKVLFFKDLNGNRIKDENEPGIKNVLVNFRRDTEIDYMTDDYDYGGEFNNVELLSNQYGEANYLNLPQGKYNIQFIAMDKEAGNFKSEYDNVDFVVRQNETLNIPFFEQNKIFGKVVMNRSKISNLGKISIANIKVTATDTKGNVYSTLTNADGTFVIYVPNVDRYFVKINNIFHANFELQQNNYQVQLNGYKQFELSFIFNEKSRRIRFSGDSQRDQFKISSVRRTTLSGSIKDANSSNPLRANIKVVKKSNNQIVAQAYSNLRTGKFSMSFLAGKDYILVVTANDYWYHSENLNIQQVTTFNDVNKDVQLKPIAVGSQITLNNFEFESGSAELLPVMYPELDRLLTLLKDNPNIILEITGHTDDLEALDSGPELSGNRAKEVGKYLITNGASNIKTKGAGNSVPIASNDTENGRKRNRRVEVTVIKK